MCGIVGFQDNQQPNQAQIHQMMDSIKHRGPDEEGLFIYNTTALGHVRLSIIDLENGQQPFISEDKRYTLIFNGEIYNYLELKQKLISKGYSFRTQSDSEVLLNGYIAFGKKILTQLNGMFAFCIYDKKTDELFLARDHFGIKPLYYYQKNNCFVFGSEIKAILKHPKVKAEVDSQSLQEYLSFQFVLKKHTLFSNIHKLEPATYIVVNDGLIKEKQTYWNLTYEIDDSKTEREYADELLSLISDSVKMQVRSDVPIGAYLSGGLDSSIVSVLASQHTYEPLSTFTGAFEGGKEFDESAYASIVNKTIQAKSHLIYPNAQDFLKHFEKLVYHMDEPAAGPGVFPQFMVSKLASENVKVVLGGQGGDELFGGYARYSVAYLEQCLKGAIFENQEEGKHIVTLKSIIENLSLLKDYFPMLKTQFSYGLFDSMEARYYNLVKRSHNLNSLMSSDYLTCFNEDIIYDKFLQIFNESNCPSYFNKMTYFDLKTLLPALLQVEDRVSMAVSVESRVPLLDKRIIELATKMPPTYKYGGGKTKNMLIKAVKNIIPSEITNRKDKMGFPTPLNDWFAGPLKEYILDIFNSQACKERGLFNTTEIINQIDKEGKFNRDIWGALNLEVWHRTFIDK